MSEPNQNKSSSSSRESELDRHTIPILYTFSAVYPVLHYLLNNLDIFTFSLTIQFAFVACLIPGAVWLALRFFVGPSRSWRARYLLNLVAAMAVFVFYMRPFLRQFPIWALKVTGFDFGTVLIWVPVFVVCFGLGYRLRSVLPSFLSLVLILTAARTAYAAHTFDSSRDHPAGEAGVFATLGVPFETKPSIYILVVDGYLNRQGLIANGLESFDVGPKLSDRGFSVYENAYSNYRPSIRSMTAFFDIQHHYYQSHEGWADTMTGDNNFYSLLRSNDYTTAIVHPSDFLLRGHCKSELCYPALDKLGKVAFLLAETLFYRADFTKRTRVGKERYKTDFYRLLEETPSPAVFYSHVSLPNHAPDGCKDPKMALQRYALGVHRANVWLRRTIDRIESFDAEPLIVVMGDHGAFLSDNCNRRSPDASSSDVVIDQMGVLLAVKWPANYDGRYDSGIHSLMDLSWYLVQFLSDDAMDETAKPTSASYLLNKKENLIYEVVRDGKITPNPVGVEKKAFRFRAKNASLRVSDSARTVE